MNQPYTTNVDINRIQRKKKIVFIFLNTVCMGEEAIKPHIKLDRVLLCAIT